MKIAADENILLAREAFATLGDVQTMPGRAMRPDRLEDVDLLLVRSVTRVDESLLKNSRVRFVGSATIGTDHVDLDWLQARGIAFANAPGCNAEAAAEYVLSATLAILQQRRQSLSGMTAGIVGCGNVGSLVREKLSVLGVSCLINDPPRQEAGARDDFVDLDTALGADIVTFHVPLTRDGAHPTRHLLNGERLQRLRPGTILINTSRGPVVDNQALLERLSRNDLDVVLDVWEGEPALDPALLERVRIGTPHIAGYSVDGKIRGTSMIYTAACRFLNIEPAWTDPSPLMRDGAKTLTIEEPGSTDLAVTEAVHGCYDARRDDARLRGIIYTADTAAEFDLLRKNYPVRREFSAISISSPSGPLRDLLGKLGFRID